MRIIFIGLDISQKPRLFINNSKGDILMKDLAYIKRRYNYGKNSN